MATTTSGRQRGHPATGTRRKAPPDRSVRICFGRPQGHRSRPPLSHGRRSLGRLARVGGALLPRTNRSSRPARGARACWLLLSNGCGRLAPYAARARLGRTASAPIDHAQDFCFAMAAQASEEAARCSWWSSGARACGSPERTLASTRSTTTHYCDYGSAVALAGGDVVAAASPRGVAVASVSGRPSGRVSEVWRMRLPGDEKRQRTGDADDHLANGLTTSTSRLRRRVGQGVRLGRVLRSCPRRRSGPGSRRRRPLCRRRRGSRRRVAR
jgi:hypothetical protein